MSTPVSRFDIPHLPDLGYEEVIALIENGLDNEPLSLRGAFTDCLLDVNDGQLTNE